MAPLITDPAVALAITTAERELREARDDVDRAQVKVDAAHRSLAKLHDLLLDAEARQIISDVNRPLRSIPGGKVG